MMFFFIGGIQPKTVSLKKQPKICPVCGYSALYLKRVDHYLSLFFIPLVPVKKGTPFQICENCKAIFDEQGSEIAVGKETEQDRCSGCGQVIVPDFKYCPYCGKAVRSAR